MRKTFSISATMLCISQFLSCTPDIEPPPTQGDYSSSAEEIGVSSSSLFFGTVLCLFGGVCTSIVSENCSAIGGQIVQNCPTASSSSGGVSPPLLSSCSAVVQQSSSSASSSSLLGLSSSSLPSSTVLCLYSGVCISIVAGDCSTIGGQVVQSCPATSSSSAAISSSSSVAQSSSTVTPSCSSVVQSSSNVTPNSSSSKAVVPSSSSASAISSSSIVMPSSSSVAKSSSSVATSSASGTKQQVICTDVSCTPLTLDVKNGECIYVEINWSNEYYHPNMYIQCKGLYFPGGFSSEFSLSIKVDKQAPNANIPGKADNFTNLISNIPVGKAIFDNVCVSFNKINSVECNVGVMDIVPN